MSYHSYSPPSSPTFNFSDWNGSISVDAAGKIYITNGNATSITTNPTQAAANTNPGTNQVTILVTVTVPSGYDNTAATVQNNVTVTQPTSYTPPQSCPNPIAVNGYYPLYTTITCAQQHTGGNGGYHSHELDGVTYYMPNGLNQDPNNGLVTQWHGTYVDNCPNPIAVNGYYPLYEVKGCSNQHIGGNNTSHTHELNGITYYMPSGLNMDPNNGPITQWHGDYPSGDTDDTSDTDDTTDDIPTSDDTDTTEDTPDTDDTSNIDSTYSTPSVSSPPSIPDTTINQDSQDANIAPLSTLSDKSVSDKRIKPDILSSNTLLRRNLKASAPPGFDGLEPDVERDVPGKNRHLEIRRDDDKVRDTTITLQDIDEAVLHHLSNELNLSVQSHDKTIKVPIVYGSGERWKTVQADGYYRDKNGRIQTPLVMFKRTSVEKRRDIGNKLDGNKPNLYIAEANRYSARNVYDRFNLANVTRRPQREIFQVPVPDYIFVNYSAILWTDFMSQNNKLVEAIEYSSDSYWGDKEKNLFQVVVNQIQNVNELQVGEDRLVRATFDFQLAGYLLPDTFKRETQAVHKQFTPSEIVITTETVRTMDDLHD